MHPPDTEPTTMSVVAHREHRARRTRRAAPRLDDGDEEHAAARVEPFGAPLQYFEIDAVHGDSDHERTAAHRGAPPRSHFHILPRIARYTTTPAGCDRDVAHPRRVAIAGGGIAAAGAGRRQPRRGREPALRRDLVRKPGEEVVRELLCRTVDEPRSDLGDLAADLRVHGVRHRGRGAVLGREPARPWPSPLAKPAAPPCPSKLSV